MEPTGALTLCIPPRIAVVEETLSRASKRLEAELSSLGMPYVLLKPDPATGALSPSPASLALSGHDGAIGIMLQEEGAWSGSIESRIAKVRRQLDETDLPCVLAVAGSSTGRLVSTVAAEGFSLSPSTCPADRFARTAIPLIVSASPARLPHSTFESTRARSGFPCLPAGGDARLGGSFWLSASQHSICIGSTGSGKTVSCAAPAILRCAQSCERPDLLVVDAKDSLLDTLKERIAEEGYTVREINLRGHDGDSYNPLGVPAKAARDGRREADDLLEAVLSLIDSIHSASDPYWTHAARQVARAVFWCIIEAGAVPTLPKISRAFGMSAMNLHTLAKMAGGKAGRRLEQAIAVARADSTWGSIQGVGSAALSYFSTTAGERVSGSSTFELTDALRGSQPLALFIIQPDESDAACAYTATVINQAVALRTSDAEEGAAPARDLQIFCDEFATLPRCSVGSVLSRGRSRRIFTHVFLQSIEQLYESGTYSAAEASTMLEQAQVTYLMRGAGIGAEDRIARLCPGMQPGTLDGMATGDAIIQCKGSPLVRTHLSPIEHFLADVEKVV